MALVGEVWLRRGRVVASVMDRSRRQKDQETEGAGDRRTRRQKDQERRN